MSPRRPRVPRVAAATPEATASGDGTLRPAPARPAAPAARPTSPTAPDAAPALGEVIDLHRRAESPSSVEAAAPSPAEPVVEATRDPALVPAVPRPVRRTGPGRPPRRAAAGGSPLDASSTTPPAPPRRPDGERRTDRREATAAQQQARRRAPLPEPVPARQLTGRSVLVLAVLLVAVMLVAPTLRVFVNQQLDMAATRADIAAQERQRSEYEETIRRWDDPQYVEQQARERLDLVMPGETLYSVTGLPAEDASAPADDGAPAETVNDRLPWAEGLWDSVVRAGER